MLGEREPFALLTENGVVAFCNDAFAGLLGAARTEVTGAHINTWLKPLDNASEEAWYGHGKGAETVLLGGPSSPRLRCRLEHMARGQDTVGCTVLFVELEESPNFGLEGLYLHAFNLNPGLSAITTVDTGIHLDVNNAWLKAMGYERREVIGKTAGELNIWKNKADRAEIVRRLHSSGMIDNFEAQIRTKDNSELDIVVSAKMVEHRGRRLCFFASHDITEIKCADRERTLLQQKLNTLERCSRLDPLTKIANRRHFDQAIPKTWNICLRRAEPISLLFVDVDFFKKYNDRYGHQAGDVALRAVAQAMNVQVGRPDDLLCRYGGEEFCCLLPYTDTQGAWHIAKRFQKAVQLLGITHEESPISPYLTVSIGIASTVPQAQDGPGRLIGVADHNLYLAKSRGRARIEGEDGMCGNMPPTHNAKKNK